MDFSGRKEAKLLMNRVEELVLEAVVDKVTLQVPKWESDEERTDYSKGYEQGWWDCIQAFTVAADSHNEGNVYSRELQ